MIFYFIINPSIFSLVSFYLMKSLKYFTEILWRNKTFYLYTFHAYNIFIVHLIFSFDLSHIDNLGHVS